MRASSVSVVCEADNFWGGTGASGSPPYLKSCLCSTLQKAGVSAVRFNMASVLNRSTQVIVTAGFAGAPAERQRLNGSLSQPSGCLHKRAPGNFPLKPV